MDEKIKRNRARFQTFENLDIALPAAHEFKFPFPLRLLELQILYEEIRLVTHEVQSNCDGSLDPFPATSTSPSLTS